MLLDLASRVKFPQAGLSGAGSCLQNGRPITRHPVVIIAGGTETISREKLAGYRWFIMEGFRDFSGTIVSGGTTAGVSGLAGDVQAAHKDTITTLGYLPATIPPAERIDTRYHEIRRTDGDRFSAKEPLRYWTDILASGISPSDVRLVGISGGNIAAAEYRIALMLGAKVCIIKDSGRAAAKLLVDKDWNGAENLIAFPHDGATLRAFIGSGAAFLTIREREELAEHIHEEYRKMQVETFRSDPKNLSLRSWEELDTGLKESNRKQADHTFEKLRAIGYGIRKVKGKKPTIITFTKKEIEKLAEMEHGRWNAERLSDGWKISPEKDRAKKVNPYLVSWTMLPDSIREWDRNTVRQLPHMLAEIGYEVYKKH